MADDKLASDFSFPASPGDYFPPIMGDPGEEEAPVLTPDTSFAQQFTVINASGAGQSITNDTTTVVTLGVLSSDDEGFYDVVNFPNEIRISRPGAFWVKARFVWAANATGYRYGEVYQVSSATGLFTTRLAATPTLGVDHTMVDILTSPFGASFVSEAVPLRVGLKVRHTAGAALSLDYAELAVRRLAGTKPLI